MAWLWMRIALDWQWGERCRPTSMLFFYHGADLHVLQAAVVMSSILLYDRIQWFIDVMQSTFGQFEINSASQQSCRAFLGTV